jgi:hypothetical protein
VVIYLEVGDQQVCDGAQLQSVNLTWDTKSESETSPSALPPDVPAPIRTTVLALSPGSSVPFHVQPIPLLPPPRSLVMRYCSIPLTSRTGRSLRLLNLTAYWLLSSQYHDGPIDPDIPVRSTAVMSTGESG